MARGASARLSEPDFLFLSFSAIYFVTVPSILAPAAPAMGMCSATYADAPFSPAQPRMHENLVAEQQLERSKMSAWQILGAFFSIVMLVTTTYPAWAGLIMAYYPRDVINTAVYAISTPFIGFFPSQFLAFNKADGGGDFWSRRSIDEPPSLGGSICDVICPCPFDRLHRSQPVWIQPSRRLLPSDGRRRGFLQSQPGRRLGAGRYQLVGDD